ncbi:hypothetical protein BJX70DRAFT_359032 [Aspergillus crustosus]
MLWNRSMLLCSFFLLGSAKLIPLVGVVNKRGGMVLKINGCVLRKEKRREKKD